MILYEKIGGNNGSDLKIALEDTGEIDIEVTDFGGECVGITMPLDEFAAMLDTLTRHCATLRAGRQS